jgi:hypothetical protein
MDNDDIVMRDSITARPVGSDYADTHSGMSTGSGSGTGLIASGGISAATDESDRNRVFSSLVKAEGDIVGLVAYSIYKQNKLDWLLAFQRTTGREPNENENAAYIIGEATPRRLATYRHLAESTLAGSGPDVPSATGKTGERSSFSYRGKAIGAQSRGTTLAIYAVLAVVVIIAIITAARFLR